MPPPYCYDYPRPSVTVDLAAFALDGGALRVLLVRRKHDPFAGRWALPGGFLNIDEPIEAAALRELREETGVEVSGPLTVVGVYGDPGRDPRGRTISVAHLAALPGPPPPTEGADDAEESAWVDPFGATGLAFDHDRILADALGLLQSDIYVGKSGVTLMPGTFDEDDVRSLFRAVHLAEEEPAFEKEFAFWIDTLRVMGHIEPVPGPSPRFRATGP